MEEEELTYDPELKKQWKAGTLRAKWLNDYPQLFEQARECAENQPDYHFGEWYAALHYFEKGWKVFIESYMFGYNEQRRVVERLIGGEENAKIVQGSDQRKTGQAPDLFIYKDSGEYRFVEVKLGDDRFKPKKKGMEQEEHFKKIEKALGCDIVVLKLKPKK